MRLTLLLLALAPLGFAQPTCPVGFELGSTAVCLPALTVAPAVAPAVAPSQFFSLGGGVNSSSPVQPFGYYSLSQRVGLGLYTTQLYEYARGPGGAVVSCARAGLSKVVQHVGPVAIGIVGDAGACESSVGSAGAAIAERGFLDVPLGKSAFHFIVSGELLKIAGSGQQGVVTLGFGFGK